MEGQTAASNRGGGRGTGWNKIGTVDDGRQSVQTSFESPNSRGRQKATLSRKYARPIIQHGVTDLLAGEEFLVFQLGFQESILEKIRV